MLDRVTNANVLALFRHALMVACMRSMKLTSLATRENVLLSDACTLTPCYANDVDHKAMVISRLLESGAIHQSEIPDTIEVMCGLALDWPGRLGVVNVRVCLEDELKFRREVPDCVALEAVKLRYLSETYTNR